MPLKPTVCIKPLTAARLTVPGAAKLLNDCESKGFSEVIISPSLVSETPPPAAKTPTLNPKP